MFSLYCKNAKSLGHALCSVACISIAASSCTSVEQGAICPRHSPYVYTCHHTLMTGFLHCTGITMFFVAIIVFYYHFKIDHMCSCILAITAYCVSFCCILYLAAVLHRQCREGNFIVILLGSPVYHLL